jgi:glutaconate CoA-transferase subunit B
VSRPDGVTDNELLAVMGARQLRDHQTVFTGVGAPMLASALAQRLQAPGLTMVIEGGIVGPLWRPGWLPISTNEMRAAYRAQMLPGITDAFLLAQRGFLDVGFIGGAQIDAHGNVNTSFIGPVERPKVRLPGSGGANDIVSLCREFIILTTHEPRRFTERVDFITSPGWLEGHGARQRSGLLFGGAARVVTTLGILGFDPVTHRLRLEGLYPGVTIDELRASTPFELGLAEPVAEVPPPTAEELRILRELDPERRFTG